MVPSSAAPQTPSPDLLSRRISHLQALHRIGVALAETLDPREIMQRMLKEVMLLSAAESAVIYLPDNQSQQLVPQLGIGNTAPLIPLDMHTSSDLAVQVAHTGSSAQCSDMDRDCEGDNGAALCNTSADGAAQEAVNHFCRLCVPLVAGDEVLGVIDMRTNYCSRIEPDMEEMLSTLASQAALVLRNASIHSELEHHYREISLLYEVQQELSSTFEYENVLRVIAERTRRLFDARECTIRLLEERGGKRFIRIAATTGRQFIGPDILPFEQAVIDHQVLGGEMIMMDDVRSDPRFPDREDAADAGVVSMICAPMVARRTVIGTIRLYTGERREFTVADRKLFLAVAGQAAVALEHARLYSQVELKNKELLASNDRLRRAKGAGEKGKTGGAGRDGRHGCARNSQSADVGARLRAAHLPQIRHFYG